MQQAPSVEPRRTSMFNTVLRGFSRPDHSSSSPTSSTSSTSFTHSSYSSASLPTRRRVHSRSSLSPPLSINHSGWGFEPLEEGTDGDETTPRSVAIGHAALEPPSSAAKRYSNMFRNSMISGASASSDEVNDGGGFFDDFAFLEAQEEVVSPKATKSKPLRGLRRNKNKHASKASTSSTSGSGFLSMSLSRATGLKRSDSLLRESRGSQKSAPSFYDVPFETEAQSLYTEDKHEPEIQEEIEEPSSLPDSDAESGGGGFFSDMQALEEQIVVTSSTTSKTLAMAPKAKNGLTKGLMKSTATLSRFKPTRSSPKSSVSITRTFRSGDSVSSAYTPSLRSTISTNTLTKGNESMRISSQSPSVTSTAILPSAPPSLTNHSSSPSLSSTNLPSPSAPSRHASMQFTASTKGLPALPLDFSAPDTETPRAATFGHGAGSPPPQAQYLFDPPSPNPSTRIENGSPFIENSSPRVENNSPRVENSSPRIQNNSPRFENSSPRIENSSPRIENSSPRIENSSPQPFASYSFDSAISRPKPDLSPRSPRSSSMNSSPSGLASSKLPRAYGVPQPPPKHSRQPSANYQVQPARSLPDPSGLPPPRASSLNAPASSPSSSPNPGSEVRLNRASLSAVLAEREARSSMDTRRSSRSSGHSSSSGVNPTAEDLALLPTATFTRAGVTPTAEDLAILPTHHLSRLALQPPGEYARRRVDRSSVLSMDGGPASPCYSIIAAFPNPPAASPTGEEGVESQGMSLAQTLAQVQQQLYPHLQTGQAPQLPPLSTQSRVRNPNLRRAQDVDLDVRPESDAFSFDDDYWLSSPARGAMSPMAMSPATPTGRTPTSLRPNAREFPGALPQPLRLAHSVAAQNSLGGSATPTSPALLTPELVYPATVKSRGLPQPAEEPLHNKSTTSLDSGSKIDLNALIEHARPESATLPDFVSVDGSLRSRMSIGSLHSPRSSTRMQMSDDGDHGGQEVLNGGDERLDEYELASDVEDDGASHRGVKNFSLENLPATVYIPADPPSRLPTPPVQQKSPLPRPPSSRRELPPQPNKGRDSPPNPPPRSVTPTSEAAQMDAFLALQSLASAAGYRLVRASYVPPRTEEPEGQTTPTSTAPPVAAIPTDAAATPRATTPLASTRAYVGGPRSPNHLQVPFVER